MFFLKKQTARVPECNRVGQESAQQGVASIPSVFAPSPQQSRPMGEACQKWERVQVQEEKEEQEKKEPTPIPTAPAIRGGEYVWGPFECSYDSPPRKPGGPRPETTSLEWQHERETQV